MRGLALEGGGARGAYHVGVVKALFEQGCDFDGYVGTSVGAINAALLAQGDFDRALKLWEHITMEQLFDDDAIQLFSLADSKSKKPNANLGKALASLRNSGGIGTEKMKILLSQYIDEERLRGSGKDFGLVTVSLGNIKPHELMLEDIPHGQLISYIMASASFPGFQSETIDENVFLDGAFFDNCPYRLLSEKGYDEVIAVRTNAPGVFHRVDNEKKVRVITVRQDLGPLMLFSPERSAGNITLGYYDGLRFCRSLRGREYYVEPDGLQELNSRIMSLSDETILESGKLLGFQDMPAKRMLFEKIIPRLSIFLRLEKDYDYTDFALALLERAAKRRNIERFNVYSYNELSNLTRQTPVPQSEKRRLLPLTIQRKPNKRKAALKLLSDNLLEL